VGTVNRPFADDSTGRDLGEGVDDGLLSNDDIVEAEITFSFHAETADESGIHATAIAEGEQIIFTELGALLDAYVPADAGAKQAVVQHL
jgi:hypothetical protein